ncbi:MAG TPA: Rnf-Nqr domain containing protein, partial [Saprospiraceae bacterium]|nr:Rnf-Nqr domain containing protein [Saprospiraceae bacterium]
GLGIAVIFVQGITIPMNWLIDYYLLGENGFFGIDLTFLRFIIFISTIAALVQLVEMVVEKFSPSLYNSLGIFLPLITVNCAILGGSLFMITKEYNFSQSLSFGLGGGFGWALAIVAIAGIREKMAYSNIPPALRGLGMAFFITGMMGIAFMGLMGIDPAAFK